jgi:PmbA protein
VDGKFSGHSASDVRLDSLKPFLQRAIEATRFLEADPHRVLPSIEEMGATTVDLDVNDHSWESTTAEDRRERLNILEAASHNASAHLNVRSITHHVWDSKVQSHVSASNGYSQGWERTSFGMGGEITLVDGERLPEAYDYRSARHQADLPTVEALSAELIKRAESRLGSSGIRSAQMPVLLRNFAANKIIGTFLSPLSGTSIYEQRSCMLGKLGEQVAASNMTIVDNPLLPRAFGSRPYDNDGFETKPRTIVENGVLNMYLLNLYNARRLQSTPTMGGASNICVAPTQHSPMELIRDLPQCIVIEGFLGGNANPITGDFSYGITGRYFEKGEFVQGISEMNISGNILEVMSSFEMAANDVWTYSSYRTPSLLFGNVQCSGV